MTSTTALRHIAVMGAGTMGCQIALQCASHGRTVTIIDVDPAALDRARTSLRQLAEARSRDEVPSADPDGITLTDDWDAASVADLVSESVPEDPTIKAAVFNRLAGICPEHTLFTTNTSTLLPSSYAEATGRPGRFAALHFHLPTWRSLLVDVMPHPGTSPATIEALVDFAHDIGQVPITMARESSGYLFNAMYSALNGAAIGLAARGVASVDDIDLAWSTVMKTAGPFRMLDHVGIDTVHQITQHWATQTGDPAMQANADWLRGYVDRGWLGVKTGRGFHQHDPAVDPPDDPAQPTGPTTPTHPTPSGEPA